MKTIHIILILVVVVAVAIVVSTFTDSGTYSTFSEAAAHPGREFHIIGTLNQSKPLIYDPQANANEFSFHMLDENGEDMRVIYRNAKPQDFEKSEKVVIIGSMQDDHFEAKSLLLKCPSKYNDQNKPEGFGEKTYSSD